MQERSPWLQAGHVSKCLEREGLPSTADGAKLRLWSCSGRVNQAFQFPNVLLPM